MQKYILEIMKDSNNGLFFCELPTGYGKTYNVVQAMKMYAEDPCCERKIIYLTTLNKNLPEEELLDSFGRDETVYNKYVLRIRSNFDEVTEKLLDLTIPDEFSTDTYDLLLNLVERYKRAIMQKAQDPEYMRNLKERLNEAEINFRREITKQLKKNFHNKQARLKAIHTDAHWSWIGELYPAVFTDEHQILLMSISKFMKRNSCLIEPSYEFLQSDLLNNAVIFIDEFDATKTTIQDAIAEQALAIREEYLSLFRHILRGMDPRYLSTAMRSAYERLDNIVPERYSFKKILEEASAIEEKYAVYLSYKTVEEAVDRRQNFLLKDATYHTLFHNGKDYIRAAKNSEENRVDIYFETREEFYANKEKNKENNVVVYALLREINRFLAHFRVFLFSWARNYMQEINSCRNPEDDELSMENAISSILGKFDLGYAGQQIILSDMRGLSGKRAQESLLPDISFYQLGMEIFELEDNDAHHDTTSLRLVAVSDTPEKILTYLAEKTSVIGISATAEVPSVVGNYDLSYLNNKLGELYHPTPESKKLQIREELSLAWEAYKDGRVKIHTEVVPDQSVNFDAQEICEEFFYNSDFAMVCAGIIRSCIADEYYQLRYCNIAKAMHRFCSSSIGSMLYLGMALPKKNHPEFDEELLGNIFKLVKQDCSMNAKGAEDVTIESASLFFLKSEHYEEDKDIVIQSLGKGNKIFIMSSYQTIGAGQNLQYEAMDKTSLVELVPYKNNGDKRHFYKDIDAIYLGDVTNLTANTYSEQCLSEKELVGMLFQIEELKENAEISFAEADDMVKLAFRAFTGRGHTERNVLYKTESVKLQATRQVMQAVGRMCRTYLKSSDIYIFIEERLLEKLSAGELKKHILPPEMQEIVKCREALGTEYSDEQLKCLRKAEKISTYGMWKIRQILSRNWNEQSMEVWRVIRQITLKHPTASLDLYTDNDLLHDLYITSGMPQKRYFYSQYSDFSDVTIDFGTDPFAFRNSSRAKMKAETGDVLVYEMSEEESGLPSLMKYSGLKNYFEENGYATTFADGDYMMSPVLFHNIYKGALGEVAGCYILRRELGVELSEITEPDRFEFFDFEMSPDVYVDFKNWKFSYLKDRDSVKKDILRKLDAIGGKKVYIINVIGDPNSYMPTAPIDARIIEIPCLIDKNGYPISKCLNMIREEDFR